jgi:DNA-binding MarR family transcriptional regulator
MLASGMTHTDALQRLFTTASLGAPENAVGFVLWRVVHRYLREVDRALISLELTHLQFMTLTMTAWLSRQGAPVTQSDLAALGNIHPMQISQMLKTLERKGMVVRIQNPSDVRAKHVNVTAAGVKALRAALPLVIEVQQRLFGDDGKVGGRLLGMLLRIDKTQQQEGD